MNQRMAQDGTAQEGFAAAVQPKIGFSKQQECLCEGSA
jgi:hypothetical protein